MFYIFIFFIYISKYKNINNNIFNVIKSFGNKNFYK